MPATTRRHLASRRSIHPYPRPLHYLWRPVDQHDVALDILVRDQRNGAAAKRFLKHMLPGLQDKPRRLITDEVARLRRRSTSKPARCPASHKQVFEQSRRKLASTHPTRRPADVEVQIGQSGTAVPLGARDNLRTFEATAPSPAGSRLSMRSRRGVPDLAAGDLCPPSGVIPRQCRRFVRTRLCVA